MGGYINNRNCYIIYTHSYALTPINVRLLIIKLIHKITKICFT